MPLALKDSATNKLIKRVGVVITISGGYSLPCCVSFIWRLKGKFFSLESVPAIIVPLLSNRWVCFFMTLYSKFPLMSLKLKRKMCGVACLTKIQIDVWHSGIHLLFLSFASLSSPFHPSQFIFHFDSSKCESCQHKSFSRKWHGI